MRLETPGRAWLGVVLFGALALLGFERMGGADGALLAQVTGCFTPAAGSPVMVGATPTGAAVGNFNSDGLLDLAVTNRDSNNVSILLGNGMGGFTPAASVAVGLSPAAVVTGDFNGDTRLDLAVVNAGDGTVSILLGNGMGGFAPAAGSPVAVGTAPFSIAAGLFNADGFLDLAVANFADNSVSILLGNGLGGFAPAVGSPVVVGTGPRAVAVGNFNGGALDLAVANGTAGTVTILLGDGLGGFTPAAGSPVGVGTDPRSVAIGLFNGDTFQDLAVANGSSPNVTILLGNGAGGFVPAAGSPVAVGSSPRSVVTGDFNGDGRLDLAVANFAANTVTVLLGDGLGGFAPAVWSPVAVGTNPTFVVTGDFEGNGRPDLAVVNNGADSVSILLNTCVPPTSTPTSTSTPTATATAISTATTTPTATPTATATATSTAPTATGTAVTATATSTAPTATGTAVTATATSTAPTATGTVVTATPTATGTVVTATPTATGTAVTATATSTAPTATGTVVTATPTATGTVVTATATSTAPTATGTVVTATPTATATPAPCFGSGTICHAALAVVPNANRLTGTGFLWASGPVEPGPCLPAGRANCVQTTNIGSFTVGAALSGLLPGDVPLVRIPVVNGLGGPQGLRNLPCTPAGGSGSSTCAGVIAEPGILPLLGGLVEVRLSRAAPTATPLPTPTPAVPILAVPPPLLPPPPPIVLPPPPAPALVPVAPPPLAVAPRAAPEVPVIPEAESGALLGSALVALSALGWLRRRRRED